MEKAYSVFCYSNDAISAEDLSQAIFVIRMLSDGFCLAVLSKDENLLSLHQYVFSPSLSAEEKIDAIGTVCEQTHLRCGKAIFQLYTNINTQIPEEFYVENLNNAIADLLITNSKDYVPVGEKIAGENLYNLSLCPAILLKKIKEKFPKHELRTTLVALLAKIAGRKPQEESFIFVENNNFTVIARNTKGLLACNCFAFETEDDFLYYCLFFLRKMFPNAENVPLFLGGNITEESLLFASLKKYIAKIEWIKKSGESSAPIANYHYYCDFI
jgi:hypothetical protein